MKPEDLAEIERKVTHARDLVAAIKRCDNADPYKGGTTCALTTKSGDEPLSDHELKKVIALGLERFRQGLEGELAVISIQAGPVPQEVPS